MLYRALLFRIDQYKGDIASQSCHKQQEKQRQNETQCEPNVNRIRCVRIPLYAHVKVGLIKTGVGCKCRAALC